MVRVAGPCPALAAGEAPSLVFIEVADTRLARPGDDLAAATAAPLPIRGTGGLFAALGDTVSVPWGGCLAEPCEPGIATLAITPRLHASDAQRVELAVELVPPRGSREPIRSMELHARNQQPALLRFEDGVPSKPVAWIVTPYLMSSTEGLKQMRACKMAAAQRSSL